MAVARGKMIGQGKGVARGFTLMGRFDSYSLGGARAGYLSIGRLTEAQYSGGGVHGDWTLYNRAASRETVGNTCAVTGAVPSRRDFVKVWVLLPPALLLVLMSILDFRTAED